MIIGPPPKFHGTRDNLPLLGTRFFKKTTAELTSSPVNQ